MAQFTIHWNDLENRFEPATLGLRLVMKVKGVETPIKVIKTTFEPDHIIKLEKDESRCTDTRIAWFAKLEDEILSAKDFYQRVMEPVQLKVEIQQRDPPADGSAPETYTQTSTIKVKVPPAIIHWLDLDEPAGVEDQDPLEVEADGVDELNLQVYLERWNVDVGSMWEDDTVEFSHWTGPTLKPEYFGPHPDDVPDKVADPETGNRRQHSRWKSICPLPSEEHPEAVLPIVGHIRVRAWPNKDIASRSPGAIHFTGDAKGLLAEQHVPVHIVPVKLEARLSEPQEIIPANGEPIDIVLEIWKVRKHERAKKAQISWELSSGPEWAQGGEFSHDGTNLIEADSGEVRITYTPPELWYQPGGKYTQELIVYNGAAATKTEIGRFTLLLGPALDVEIDMEKLGLEQETNGLVQRDAGECPVEITGWLEHEATAAGTSARHRVAHAKVKLTFVGESDEMRTEKELPFTTAEGKFTVSLPELEKHGLRMPEIQRILELDEDELPEIVLDEAAEEQIVKCEDQISRKAPHDWYRAYSSELDRKLVTFRLPYAGHLCQRPPEDRHQTIASADLIRVGGSFGPLYENIFHQTVKAGCSEFTSMLADVFGMVVTAMNFGEKLAQGIAWGAGKVGAAALKGLGASMEFAHKRLGDILGLLGSGVARLGGWLGTATQSFLQMLTTRLTRTREILGDFVGLVRAGIFDLTSAIGPLIQSAGAAVADMVKFLVSWLGDKFAVVLRSVGPWLSEMGLNFHGAAAAERQALNDLVEQIARAWGQRWAVGTLGELSLSKVTETIYKEMISFLTGKAGGATDPLARMLLVFGTPVQLLNPYGVDAMANDVIAWKLPGDIDATRFQLDNKYMDLSQALHQRILENIEWDVWFDCVDLVVTAAQFVLWLVGALSGWGLLAAAAVKPLMDPIEQGVGAVKLILRSPQLFGHVSAGWAICTGSDAHIRELTVP